MDDSRLTCLRVYSDAQQARLTASILSDHGIDCSVTGDEIAGSLSWYGLAVKKIQLLVRASDAPAACTVLEKLEAEHEGRNMQKSEFGVELNWVCATCDENNANTFDECWSCGARMPVLPERRAVEFPQTAMAVGRLSEQDASIDSSPYRPPRSELSHIEPIPQHELVPRIIRATIFSLWLWPLAFYTLFLISAVFRHGEPPPRVYVALAVSGLIATLFIVWIGAIIRDLF